VDALGLASFSGSDFAEMGKDVSQEAGAPRDSFSEYLLLGSEVGGWRISNAYHVRRKICCLEFNQNGFLGIGISEED
jgi:hypothetical protein